MDVQLLGTGAEGSLVHGVMRFLFSCSKTRGKIDGYILKILSFSELLSGYLRNFFSTRDKWSGFLWHWALPRLVHLFGYWSSLGTLISSVSWIHGSKDLKNVTVYAPSGTLGIFQLGNNKMGIFQDKLDWKNRFIHGVLIYSWNRFPDWKNR